MFWAEVNDLTGWLCGIKIHPEETISYFVIKKRGVGLDKWLGYFPKDTQMEAMELAIIDEVHTLNLYVYDRKELTPIRYVKDEIDQLLKQGSKLSWQEPTRDSLPLQDYTGWLVKALPKGNIFGQYGLVKEDVIENGIRKLVGWWYNDEEEVLRKSKEHSPNMKIWLPLKELTPIRYIGIEKKAAPESYTDKSDVDSPFRDLTEWHWEDKNLSFPKDEFIGEDTQEFKTKPKVFREFDHYPDQAYDGVQASQKLSWQVVDNLEGWLVKFIYKGEPRQITFGIVIKDYRNVLEYGLFNLRGWFSTLFKDYPEDTEEGEIKRVIQKFKNGDAPDTLNSSRYEIIPLRKVLDLDKIANELPKAEEIVQYDISPLTEMNLYPSKRKDNYDYKKRNTKGDEEMLFEKGLHQSIDRPETNRDLTPYGSKLSWKEVDIIHDDLEGWLVKAKDLSVPHNIYYGVVLLHRKYSPEKVGLLALWELNIEDTIKKSKEWELNYRHALGITEFYSNHYEITPLYQINLESQSSQNQLFIYIKPDDKIPLNIDDPHTTVVYLKNSIEGKDRQKVIDNISKLLKDYKKPELSFGGIAVFDDEDKSRVILINFENGAELYSDLINILSEYIDIDRDYNFIPHMTIDKNLSIDKLPEYKWQPSCIYIEFEKNVPAIEIEFETGKVKETQNLDETVDDDLEKLSWQLNLTGFKVIYYSTHPIYGRQTPTEGIVIEQTETDYIIYPITNPYGNWKVPTYTRAEIPIQGFYTVIPIKYIGSIDDFIKESSRHIENIYTTN